MNIDPVGTVRRHFDMTAFKMPQGDWLIVYPDDDLPPSRTTQRIEDLDDKWPVVYRPGETTLSSFV